MMGRSWEKRLFVVWVLGVSLVVSSTRFQGVVSFQHRLQGAAPQLSSSSSRSPPPSLRVKRPVVVATSDASTTGRSLLELETSTDEPKNHTVSKKWRIVIIVMSTTVTAIAIAIAIFLLRKCLRGHKLKNGKSNSMLVWTNQLPSLQHLEVSGSENNSRRGSARLELASKDLNAPWLSNKGTGVAVAVPCSVSYALLQAVTQNFSSSNLLGEGSFGLVYKAQMDCDGNRAAVKRLCGVGSGKHCHKEFQGEVDLMSKIRHPNLVALLGYSNDGPEPLMVYELMQNGSLHDQLHGPSHGEGLTWHLRLKIALEAARGLEHLHENCKPPIIHRDFKASNILLDASFNAKVSDFGLAIALEGEGLMKEDVQVQGTFGYIAPEYVMDGTLTEKSDVYGFGVVLLELLTGRLPIDSSLPLGSQSLVTWVTPLLKNREKLMEILDPSLQDSVNEKHLHQVAAIAILCVQAEPSYRPLITDVVQSLLPLIPQELGGAWRDPKIKPCVDNAKLSSKKLDCEALEVELQLFHSQRSDYSVLSVEYIPKSSISDSSDSLDRTRSWENVTTSYLEQQCEGQRT